MQIDPELAPIPSQRFQVKISGQWNDYSPKEDDALKAAFDQFVRKHNDKSSIPEPESRESGVGSSRYKEFVCKGRRYLVDFLEMKQVRKDNKKEYRVRPPPGAPVNDESRDGPREQGHLRLTCDRCHKPYSLRRMPPGSDYADWADCFWCVDCWRPFLDKEEKKVEKNPKQRQAHLPSALQPCRVHAPGLEKPVSRPLDQTYCVSCKLPFQDDEVIYLGALQSTWKGELEQRLVSCQPVHKQCNQKAQDAPIDEAEEAIEKVKMIAAYFQSKGFHFTRPESMMRRYIQEEYVQQKPKS